MAFLLRFANLMNANEQVQLIHDFIEKEYINDLTENVRKGLKFLEIDFSQLSKFNPDLADELLESPEEMVRASELAIEQFDLSTDLKNMKVRFSNLPASQEMKIRNIRSEHLLKFFVIDGVVRQKSDVRPQVTSARFECPSCGNILNVLQLDQNFKEPSRCGCGRKGKFKQISKDLIDAQGIVLEEAPESLDGGDQPKRMNVLLKDDLVSPLSERKTSPGSKIKINGIIKEVPITLRSGAKSTRFDLMIEANFVEASEESFYDVKVSEEEEKQIKELSQDPKILWKLVNSLAPSIYGYDKIKEALILQIMGGVRKVRKDKVVSRGDLHILLVGDPGIGKCIIGDSKITLEDGEITTIKSFYDKNVSFHNDINKMKIFSINEHGLNISNQPTRFWRRKAPAKMLKIVTNSGNELIVTKEHPIFTTNDGLIYSKRADEYKVGEYLATPSKIKVKGSLQGFNKNVIPSKANNKVKYNLKEIFDSEFARLFGYLIGDGCVSFTESSGVIRFTNKNKNLLEDFEFLIGRVFNHKLTKSLKKGTDCWDYRCFSIELVRILEKIESSLLLKSNDMRIPSIVCKSPDYVVKEFLKSLFDCEGHVNKKDRNIEFSSKSKDLIFELKLILLRFGVLSQVSSTLKCATNTIDKIKRRYYRLVISGEDLYKYNEKIGFVSFEKKDKLKEVVNIKKEFNTNNNIIPGLSEVLKVLRQKYSLTQFSFPVVRSTYQHFERGDRYPSYLKLKKIANFYNLQKIEDPLVEIINKIANADIFWDKIKSIETIKSNDQYVYDLQIDKVHNFVAEGIVVHNSALLKRTNIIAPKGRYVSGKGVSAAGLTASVVKDEFLKGWSLEAGAMVLSSNGICCTTEDSEFILENGKKMSFKELFINHDDTFIYPKFKILSLNNKNQKIEPFEIKKGFRIRNDKRILRIKTRTGRELNLTEDNKVLVCEESKNIWKRVDKITKDDYLAVPKKINIRGYDKFSQDFAYIAGLIASDGHINIDSRHAQASFYNTNKKLVDNFITKMKNLGFNCSKYIQKKGRKSVIRGKEVISKKDLYHIYNSKKDFAKKLIKFGVSSGNKSTKFSINKKIFSYSNETISAFLKGIFDGDGSIRLNPSEISLTTGIKENAKFFQELLTRLDVVSSVKKSTNSWHCEIRGAIQCLKFFDDIGTDHEDKYNKFLEINPNEVKDRLDILPNHQNFFKKLIKENRWKMGKKIYKYFWNYSRNNVTPSIFKLIILNQLLNNSEIRNHTKSDILWDKIESINEIESEFVFDFTMKGTNNFIANNMIMHNCIDEMDKISPEDTAAMHEALENQTVSISKANVQATMVSRTTVLAAANPKFGRFDPYAIIGDQIDMPPTLINRFDLIFPLKDLPDEAKDTKLAGHILKLHREPDAQDPEIETPLLKKYIAYARQNVNPKLSEEALKDIQDYYVKMRSSGGGDGGVKSIPISARQLEALVRLSEASARTRLSPTVTKKDAKKAIELIEFCLREVGFDKETGKIDIDRIATGISASTRSHIVELKEIIASLEAKMGKQIPIDSIVEEAKLKNISDEHIDETIERLKRSGDLFEPRRGFISRI